MFARLLLIFILLPLADLVVILMLLRIHWAITVLWILVSGVVGAWYVRRQGVAVLQNIRNSIDENRLPADVFVEGALVLLAGGLLITPGLITDLLGFSLLIKPCRRWYRKRFVAWLRKKVDIHTAHATMWTTQQGDVVDAEVTGRKEPLQPETGDKPPVISHDDLISRQSPSQSGFSP